MSTPTNAPGRRSAARRRRLDVTTLLAVVLPLMCAVAALALSEVTPADEPDTAHPPTRTTLTTATLVCPEALEKDPGIAVTSTADGVDGSVSVGLGRDASDVDVTAGQVSDVDAPDPVAVTGADESAPALLAARTGGTDLVNTPCLPPVADWWFTAVGAGAGHTSVLELTNPDRGTALADVTLLSARGELDAPRLRGVSVPGHGTIRLDLAELTPRRGELALDVQTVRGRLGVSLLDRIDRVGSSPLTQEWLPGQPEPTTSQLLMGLAPGEGARVLAIANDGDDEARATLRVVTADSVFAPEGLSEVRIPPHSVSRVRLTDVVNDAIGDGAFGLSLTSTEPVTSTLRSENDGDLSLAVPGVAVREPATALLPGNGSGQAETKKSLELAGASRAGTVTVVSRAADGSELDSTKVEVVPDRGVRVELPAEAAQVTVTPARTRIHGAVLVTRGGDATVAPLVVPVTSGLVPDVRPGLP